MPDEIAAGPPKETPVLIRLETDIVTARQQGRALAVGIGCTRGDVTRIATAISELGRNILEYAREGEIVFTPIEKAGKKGIQVMARDRGPGIPDIALAMQDGYSTGKNLGLGLPGTRRLMDEFNIESAVGKGTIVTIKKWMG
ncbi:MAG: anti-sigma regulatory factor [Pseudomonadota bacterium]